MVHQLLNVVAPVFISIALGWSWSKLGRTFDTDFVSSLVMTISAPCLVFSILSTIEISPQLLGQMGIGTVAAIILFGPPPQRNRCTGRHLDDPVVDHAPVSSSVFDVMAETGQKNLPIFWCFFFFIDKIKQICYPHFRRFKA
jgi:hypothetical protein